MKKVYKFFVSYGRMGSLEGVFVATDADVKQSLGKEAYFGEVLGKHSDVYVTLTESMFKVLTDDTDFAEKFAWHHCACGFNPLHYIESQED